MTATKQDLINSDMIKLGLGTYNTTTDEENFIKLEDFLNGTTAKPLSYYGTVANAVSVLIEQGYGKVEIPPTVDSPLCFITAQRDAENDLILNLTSFGAKIPIRNVRPYTIDGISEWQVGDVVYNTDFLANRCLGWVCTSPGQPGAWEKFGDLDATKDTTTFQVIDPSGELPAASAQNLGKFVLYSNKDFEPYTMWYCTQYFEKNLKGIYYVAYKWINISDNNAPVKTANLIYNYDGWQADRIEIYDINDLDTGYSKTLGTRFAIYGIVPAHSGDTPLDTSDYQTLKIGADRYTVKYYDNANVYNGEIPEGISIVLYIDTNSKTAWLPYVKPNDVNIPLVSILKQATYKDLGKRVLFKEEGVNEYPVMYYCTQVLDEDLGIYTYKWVQPLHPKMPTQVAEIEFDIGGHWRVTKIGDLSIDSGDTSYLLKVSNTLTLVGKVPSNSINNQKLNIGDLSITLRYLDGSEIRENDIIVNSILNLQVNLKLKLATISSTPPPIEFVDKTIVKLATTVSGDNGRWKVNSIGDVPTTDNTTVFRDSLPDKLILVLQVPSDSINNQKIQIGSVDYDLTYINGVAIMSGEIKKDTILTVHGSLSATKLSIPAFPTGEVQQAADLADINDRITLEGQAREQVAEDLSNFKIQMNQSLQANETDKNDIRNSIIRVAATNFAPIDSPTLTGSPLATTAQDGDNSTRIATTAYVMRAITNLIGSSPESLNTLFELAKAINNDANFATTMMERLSRKLDVSGGIVSGTLTLINNAEPLGYLYNSPALVVGGTQNETHIELGLNNIQSKVNHNTSTVLYLNKDGGAVIIGAGGLQVVGDVVIQGNLTVAGDINSDGEINADVLNGNATTATTAMNVPTEDVGGNIWIK